MSQVFVNVTDIVITNLGRVVSILPQGYCVAEKPDGTFSIYTGDIPDFGELVGEMGFIVRSGRKTLYFDPVDSQYENVFKEALKEQVKIFEEAADDDDSWPAIC